MPATIQKLTIRKGETFEQVFRWETEPFIVKTITSISRGVSVRIVAVGHGLVNGWRSAVVGAKDLTALNAANNPPEGDDFRRATVIDADTIEFNGLSTLDAKKAHVANSGALVYYTPHDLTGYTARMSIKDKVGGTVILALTTDVDDGIEIDDSAKEIRLTISATQAAAIEKKAGVYDLELESPTGVVTAIFAGSITFTNEVTT